MTDSPGVEWRTKAARLLYKFGEWDGQKFILVENSDDATEDELDEFDSLTPYRPLLDIESHRKESLNYLNKVQPNMSKDDKEWASLRFIFKCSACDRYYPTWWISKKDWQNSFAGVVQKGIFDFWGDRVDSPRIFLCKECFEEIEQNQPKYFTINQYIAHRLVAEMGLKKENTAEYKRILSQIWDLPAA